jgi:release factor glutamine methyltransferase
MSTISQELRAAMAQLDAARVDAPATTARLLLSQVTQQSKAWLVAHGDESLSAAQLQQFHALLARVIAHEPLFYVLGHREFFGLDLIIDKRVLIPRPETEMLVELALAEWGLWNGEWGMKDAGGPFRTPYSPFPIFMDVGTGSGAVPIAIAKHAPAARLIATDISKDALDVARMNAERHGVAERITFVQADLLAGVHAMPLVITANLPYVTREEIDGLPPEIQAHEPRVALDGGDDGLDLVRRLLMQIAAMTKYPTPNLPQGRSASPSFDKLRRRGVRAAFLEFGASQGPAVLAAARSILPNAHSEIKKDLAQLDRVLALRFDH